MPRGRSAFSWPVSRGLIGPVRPLKPAAPVLISTVTCCEAPVWLVTISVIGPAPNLCGETATWRLLIEAETMIGAGGRGSLLLLVPPPQPTTAVAATARHGTTCAVLLLIPLPANASAGGGTLLAGDALGVDCPKVALQPRPGLRLGRFVVVALQLAQRQAVPAPGLELALLERCFELLFGGVGGHACLLVSPVGSMRLYPRTRSEESNVAQGSVQAVGQRWNSWGGYGSQRAASHRRVPRRRHGDQRAGRGALRADRDRRGARRRRRAARSLGDAGRCADAAVARDPAVHRDHAGDGRPGAARRRDPAAARAADGGARARGAFGVVRSPRPAPGIRAGGDRLAGAPGAVHRRGGGAAPHPGAP